MNEELKMLIISLTLFVVGVVIMYILQHQHCYVEEYQNLSGEHRVERCEIIP
jgi:hypothetical protein